MSKLKLPMLEEIENMTNAQVKKALNKLLPTYKKRIETLKKHGKLSYLKNDGAILGNFSNDKEALANIAHVLRKPFSQITKVKKFEDDMLKTLHDHGYDIKKDQIVDFNDFMGELKAMNNGRRIPDSARVVEVYIQSQRLKMTRSSVMKNLDYWREHLEEMQELSSSKAKKGSYGSKYIINRIDRMNKKKNGW